MIAAQAVRRVCFVGAALFALLALGVTVVPVVPARADDAISSSPASRFATFSGIADAAGVLQTADGQTQLEPTYQTFYGRLADGLSQYGNQTLYARSSVYYPGAAVVGLGSLLCVLAAGSPFCSLPKYPLYTYADSNTPDGAVNSPAPSGGTGSPAGIGAGNADAHVNLVKGVSTNSVLSNFDSPQGSGAVVHVGSVESRTKQAVDAKGNLVVQAISRVSGVDILGGLVHIDGIFATSTSITNGTGKPTKVEDFQIHGVTANGVPATIGAQGVTINGSGQGKQYLDVLNADLRAALAKSGLLIQAVGVTKESILNPRLCTGGEVDGLRIEGNVAVAIPPNLPPDIEKQLGQLSNVYYTKIVLGGACTDAFALTAAGGPLTGLPGAPPSGPLGQGGGLATPGLSASDNSPSGSLTGGALSIGPVTSSGGLPIANDASRGRNAQSAQVAVGRRRILNAGLENGLLGHNVTHGLTLLYLAFTLLFVGLCLGLRPFVPARLPRGR